MQSQMNAPQQVEAHPIDARSAFAFEVRRHLSAMPAIEWERLRAFGNQRHRFVDRKDHPLPALTRDELVEHCVSVDACTPDEILPPCIVPPRSRSGELTAERCGTWMGRESISGPKKRT